MHPRFRKVVLALAIIGLAISVTVAACGSDDDDDGSASPATTTTTEPATTPTTGATTTVEVPPTTGPQTETPYKTITIVVKGGRPVGGIQRPKLDIGDDAIIRVKSDVADEVHLHGYDLKQDVKAGGTAQIPLHATIPGRFEIELENSGVQLAELTVS